MKFNAHDFLRQQLLLQLEDLQRWPGATVRLELPKDLSVDDKASLLNACVVPNVGFVLSDNEEQLLLWRIS